MHLIRHNSDKPLTADQQIILSAIVNDPRLEEKDYLVILWRDDDLGYSGVDVAKCRQRYTLSVSLFFVHNKLFLMPVRREKKDVHLYLDSVDDVQISRVADTLIDLLR